MTIDPFVCADTWRFRQVREAEAVGFCRAKTTNRWAAGSTLPQFWVTPLRPVAESQSLSSLSPAKALSP